MGLLYEREGTAIPRRARRALCLLTFFSIVLVLASVTAAAASSQAPTASAVPLIPRQFIVSSGGFGAPQLSPDGKKISYIKASPEGIPNIWVRTRGAADDRQATGDKKAGVVDYRWSLDGNAFLYLKDSDGDENFHLFSWDIDAGLERDLTPFTGIKAQNLVLSARRPHEALIGLNIRDRRLFDMYRVDLETGAVELDTENPGDVRWWLSDWDFQIRACVSISAEDSRQELRVRDGRGKPWRPLIVWPFGESGVLEGYGSNLAIAFSRDGGSIFVQSALHSETTTQFLKVEIATGRETFIAQHPKANLWSIMDQTLYDHAQVLFHSETGEPQAVGFEYLKPEWKVLDPAVAADFAFLTADTDAVPVIVDRSADDRTWLVGRIYDDFPMRYYFYDRAKKTLDLVFPDDPELATSTFAKMTPVVIQARDGLELASYLTLPPGAKAEKLPLLLTVHGGPWARDSWGWSPLVQYLANRGYALLSINFRGSDGFGKKFLNAGNGQWGVGGMQNDLSDAVAWAIKRGLADPQRVGILGGSYGGYAVLAGLAFTPGLYACGVDVCGMSNVKTMFETMPDFWKPMKMRWIRRVGDAEHDEALNRRISPLYHVDAIRAPLLIGHGVNDPRVKLAESEQIVAALRKKNLPVTFIVYPDEGHGLNRPQNNLDFFGRVEEFLAKYLGGRFEPWTKVEGSSAEIR